MLDSRACRLQSIRYEARGATAEYTLAAEYILVSLPAGLDFDQAALVLGAGVDITTSQSWSCANMVQASVWEVMTLATIRALLYCKDVVGV